MQQKLPNTTLRNRAVLYFVLAVSFLAVFIQTTLWQTLYKYYFTREVRSIYEHDEALTQFFDKLLLDTSRLTIAGSGVLDLDTEELDFVLSPRPKQARLVSVANPVRVTGTLSDPNVAVTVLPRRRTATRGVIAGLINPALLVITFADIGSGSGNRCLDATEKLDSAAIE